MDRPPEIGMTLLVQETNETHKVKWTPSEILVTLVVDSLCECTH